MTHPVLKRPPIRMAMVGGASGAFIGPIHKIAAELDGAITLVAGVFSRDPTLSREAGAAYGLQPDRIYDDWRLLIDAERRRPDGAEMIAIVTPNHLHFPIGRAAIQAGYHVISDKPVTSSLAEAQELRGIVQASAQRFGVTYAYTGYPMVREARDIVRRGQLGAVRKIVVEHSQGWLALPIERGLANKQAAWRTDPTQAGAGGCVGDIGVHAFNIAEFVSGRRVEKLCADLSSVVPGRALDDDCNIFMRFEGGARGVLIASQIAAGERNALRLRLYGEAGGLDWRQEQPHELLLNDVDGPSRTLHAGSVYLGAAAQAACRLPPGHPEGFVGAFANIYRDFALDIAFSDTPARTPGIIDGVRGLAFVEQAVRSNNGGSTWVDLTEYD